MNKEYYIISPTREGENFKVKFRHIPGKRFSAGTKDRDEAVRWAERKMREIAQTKRQVTLAEFCNGFFSEADPHGYRKRAEAHNHHFSEEYYEAHEARLKNHILPFHGEYILSAITDTMIEDLFLSAHSVKGDGTRELGDNARNKILSTYRIVLDAAKREHLIPSNPAEKIEDISEEYEETIPFSEDEMRKFFPEDDEILIKNWYNLRWAAYFSLLKDTSWRPCEVAAFSIHGFYPHYKESSINAAYTDKEVHWKTHKVVPRIKTANKKGGAKYKVALISDQTVRLLNRLKEQLKGDYFFELRTEDLCFSHPRKNFGDRYIYSELANKRLRSTAGAVGIDLDGRTQYSMRHTWETDHFGMIPDDLRNMIMGHKKTRKEYVHLDADKAVARLFAIVEATSAISKLDSESDE